MVCVCVVSCVNMYNGVCVRVLVFMDVSVQECRCVSVCG